MFKFQLIKIYQVNLDRFLAMASSTAFNCFSNSSRRFFFISLTSGFSDEFELLGDVSADAPTVACFLISIDIGERFFTASIFLTPLRSLAILSVVRTRFIGVLPLDCDELSDDDDDESEPDPLESEDPEPEVLDPRRFFLVLSILSDLLAMGEPLLFRFIGL